MTRPGCPRRAGIRTAPRTTGDAGSLTWTAADDAVARHPAGRGKVADPHAAPKGPDDDQEFLAVLEQAIRRNPPVS